ncbi:MAG TPA: hypothetical protein VFP37_08735 [Steroidobacteraceae bacterium]|nr:hypothetical protein [Steroidobacteraceae bacterium]
MKWIAIGLAAVIAIAVGAWWYEGHKAEKALLKQPIYRVLKQHEPALYRELVEEYRTYQRGEERAENYVNLASSRISMAATQRLAHASQSSVLALIQDMVSTAKKLQGKPDDACFRYWFPQVSGPPDIAQLVDARSQAHTLGLMAEVIRSAAESPAPLPDPEAVKDDLTAVVDATYEQFGADAQMLSHAEDPRADHAKVCTITISVYERILRLPPARAGDLLRAMTQVR